MRYSPLYDSCITLAIRSVFEATAKGQIEMVNGAATNLRTGIVADDRNSSIGKLLRTQVRPEDLFYLYGQLMKRNFPTADALRAPTMDVDGDQKFTGSDITALIRTYVFH